MKASFVAGVIAASFFFTPVLADFITGINRTTLSSISSNTVTAAGSFGQTSLSAK